MKLSRLLAYAAAGMIVGLLMENKAIIVKQDINNKTDRLKRKAKDTARGAKEKLSHVF